MKLLFNKYKPFISYKPTADHYLRAIERADKSDIKKLAYLYIMLGVKAKPDFEYFMDIEMLLGLLTPKDIRQMFPITKVYDGGDDFKDYFNVTSKLDEYADDEMLGQDIYLFLMEYLNSNVNLFMVNFMMSVNRRNEEVYGIDLFDEIFGELPKYTVERNPLDDYNILNI